MKKPAGVEGAPAPARAPVAAKRAGKTPPAVTIRKPALRDEREFLERVRASRRLHGRWVSPPSTSEMFRSFLKHGRNARNLSYLLCTASSKEIVGVVNASEIVRGNFQSAYLGYYGFTPFHGRGVMFAGMRLVLNRLFRAERLHRVEANIQPDNVTSIALVKRLGFRKEGLSPGYLKIGGRWSDHERWALRSEEWRRWNMGERPRGAKYGRTGE